MANFKSPPKKDAQIKFIEPSPIEPLFAAEFSWIPFYTIDVPDSDLDLIFNFDERLFITPYASLKPEVIEWCQENLQGKASANDRYQVRFTVEHDAILFKLRWIG
jgi:hypothetical protein